VGSPRSAGAYPAALVLYARVPRRGRVKTRMLPWLPAADALRLHIALLEDGLRLLQLVARQTGAVPFVSFSAAWEPGNQQHFADLARAAAGIARLPQRGSDLGKRLRHTFRTLFARGFGRVVVFGSDSPTLPPSILRRAFAALRRDGRVVLSPAEDGGYVLVGSTYLLSEMFKGIPWGTGRVMAATLEALERTGAPVIILPRWFDVDVPQDLERIRLDIARRPSGGRMAERTRAFVEELVRTGRLPLGN
jgi:uncharacterized protein